MKHLLISISMLLLVPVVGVANIVGDLAENSYAEFGYHSPDIISLMVVPDGSGARLDESSILGGALVDASITVYLILSNGEPVVGFPREDMWLEAADGGFVPCRRNALADAATDADGRTAWTEPLSGSGSSLAGLQVMISGSVVPGFPVFPVRVNSPDFNADGRVDLTDVSILATSRYNLYEYRYDLNFDNALNLSDVAKFATAYGANCP